MRWPPRLSWTSTYLRQGFRHFVAINYGGQGNERWVTLVAVLDGKSRLSVRWEEMKDPSKWISGWLKLTRKEANPSKANYISGNKIEKKDEEVCLHVSKDSGLLIPSRLNQIRPWH